MTAIEDWLRDPYTIYAKHILRLSRSIPSTCRFGGADRGSAIHDARRIHPDVRHRPARRSARRLRAIGEKYFAALMERPEARALWWPRFLRIARWFADWENARRGDIAALDAEIRGEIAIPLDGRARSCCRRAPTGSNAAATAAMPSSTTRPAPPTGKQVRMGLSPQLTLEAAILREGGFAGMPPALGRRARLCQAQRRQSARRAQARSKFKDGTPDTPGRRRAGSSSRNIREASRTKRSPIAR